MDEELSFADILRSFVERSTYSYRKLAKKADLSAKTTISNWVNGYVARPRDLRAVARLADALELNSGEKFELLKSAGYSIGDPLSILGDYSDGKEWPSQPRYKSPFQAPTRIIDFCGRDDELSLLRNRFLFEEGSVCILYGMAGVGKTTLATRLAYELRPFFKDGVLWADLSSEDWQPIRPMRLNSILLQFAKAYGEEIEDELDHRSRARYVQGMLSAKNALIILDDVNRMEDVVDLLPPTNSNCSVLITTRRRTILQDTTQCRYHLKSFDLSEGITFLRKTIDGDRVENAQQEAEEIIEFVGGSPLALRVMASSLNDSTQITIHEFHELLEDEYTRLENLEDEWQDVSYNVRASLGLSYSRLSEQIRHFFVQLATFEGNSFSTEIAASLLGVPQLMCKKHIGRLHTLSLLMDSVDLVNDSNSIQKDRYRLHPLWRAFAKEKLGNSLSQLNKNFLVFFEQFATNNSHKSVAAWDALEEEIPNMFLSIRRAYEYKNTSSLISFEEALIHEGEFLNVRDYIVEAVDLLTKSLELQSVSNSTKYQARTLNKLSYFFHRVGKVEEAKEKAEEALHLAMQMNDFEQCADSHRYLGIAWDRLGNKELTLDHFNQELAIRREIGDQYQLAKCLNNFGTLQLVFGDYMSARYYLEEAISLYEEDEHGIAESASNIAVASLYLGDFEAAFNELTDALERTRRLGDKIGVAQNLINIGMLSGYKNQFTQAIQHITDAFDIAQETGDQSYKNLALSAEAEVLVSVGGWSAAALRLKEVEESLLLAPDQDVEVHFLNARGHLLYEQGRRKESIRKFLQLKDIAESADDIYFQAQSLLGLARAYLSENTESGKATDYAEEGRNMCKKWRLAGCEPRAQIYLATSFMHQKRVDIAVTHAQQAISLLNNQQYIHGSEVEIFLFATRIFDEADLEEERVRSLKKAYQLKKTIENQFSDRFLLEKYRDLPINREVSSLWFASELT